MLGLSSWKTNVICADKDDLLSITAPKNLYSKIALGLDLWYAEHWYHYNI